jgi:hypothetical protein
MVSQSYQSESLCLTNKFHQVDEEDSCAEADQDPVKTDHKFEDGRSSPSQDLDEGNALSSTAIWEFCQEEV